MDSKKHQEQRKKQEQLRKEGDRLDLEAYRNLHKAEFGFNPPNLTLENARQYFEQLDKQKQLDLQEQVAKEERDKKDRLKKQQLQDQERDKKDRLEKEQFQKQEFDKKERLKKEQFQKQELQKQAEKQRLDARNQLKTAAPVRQSSRRTQPKKRTFTAFRDMKAQHARDRGGRDREPDSDQGRDKQQQVTMDKEKSDPIEVLFLANPSPVSLSSKLMRAGKHPRQAELEAEIDKTVSYLTAVLDTAVLDSGVSFETREKLRDDTAKDFASKHDMADYEAKYLFMLAFEDRHGKNYTHYKIDRSSIGEDQFDKTWRDMADSSIVDGVGGPEYRSVKTEWYSQREPSNVQAFIMYEERLKKDQLQKQGLQKQAAQTLEKSIRPDRDTTREITSPQPKKPEFSAFRDMKAQHAHDRARQEPEQKQQEQPKKRRFSAFRDMKEGRDRERDDR
ncbi:MAG: hypothetical protein IID14_04610 [Candidatus Marinimicrobia bacterium]|nr:hypothetical protein [Candidatus Neomarinimicrobiota bacterium]